MTMRQIGPQLNNATATSGTSYVINGTFFPWKSLEITSITIKFACQDTSAHKWPELNPSLTHSPSWQRKECHAGSLPKCRLHLLVPSTSPAGAAMGFHQDFPECRCSGAQQVTKQTITLTDWWKLYQNFCGTLLNYGFHSRLMFNKSQHKNSRPPLIRLARPSARSFLPMSVQGPREARWPYRSRHTGSCNVLDEWTPWWPK